MLNSPISLNDKTGSHLTQPREVTDDLEADLFLILLDALSGQSPEPDPVRLEDPEVSEPTHPNPVERAGVIQTRGRLKRRFRAEHRNPVSKLPPSVFAEVGTTA